MSANKSFTDIATIEISRIFAPLQRLDNPESITAFVNELGWQFADDLQIDIDFDGLIGSVGTLLGTVLSIVQSSDDNERAELLLQAIEQVKDLIQEVDENIPKIETAINEIEDFIGTADDIVPIITTRFFDYLIYMYLQRYHRRIFAVLHVLGFVEIVKDTAEQPIKTVQWERIPLLFTDPKDIANQVYDWNNDQPFKGQEFLTRVEVLLKAFSLPGGLYTQSEDIRAHFDRIEDSDNQELRIPLYQGGRWLDTDSTYSELTLNVFPVPAVPAVDNRKAGLSLYPYIMGSVDITSDINDYWKFILKGNAQLDSGFGLNIRPPAKLHMDTSVFDSPNDFINAHLEIGILSKKPEDELTYIFGSKNGSYLGYGTIGFNLILALDNGKEEIAGELLINDLSLKIDMSEGDGFLQKILGGIKIETITDLVMGISNLDGFYFRGSGALEIEIPLHKSLGPIDFHTLYIRFSIADDMEFQFAVSMGFELGPITGSVEKIGIGIPFSVSKENNGNLGPVDIHRPVFVPPIGAGLSLNAGGIIGGGYLEFDNENKRYAGILSLKFGEIALVAIGLITTRMPDGSDGFSLLVNIGVTFSPPIQLSFGFTLNAVGGLIGLNRIMDTEVLQAGIKNRTLDSILFPDPDTVIENAPKIISDLRSVFPPQQDRYVIGPMVKIGWGSPSIITGAIGIFIEFPEPIRIVLLGQVEATLPKKENAVVEIHMDIIGVLDLGKKELTFQACLYDSRLLTFDMYGDTAMLLGWGNDPRFAMAMGGFHPRFTPPPPSIIFAELKRLSISISNSNKLKFSCASYQAITPNTLQFGARIDCYIAFAGAKVTGFLGFDALFYFSPFSFIADIGGGVIVKFKGVTLAEIHLYCALSGPNPWNAKGKAKFKVLLFNVKKSFNITWGDSDKRRLASKDPWSDLQKAVEATGSWSSQLPSSSTVVATLRSMEEDQSNIAVVHPSGKLQLRQNILPFGIALEKVGNAPITGHDKFEVEKIIVEKANGEEEILELSNIYEHFARGQYQNLSSSEKLALPSFEKMQAGVSTDNDDFEIFGEVEGSLLEYETILIDSDLTSKPLSRKGHIKLEECEAIRQALADRMSRQGMSINRFSHPERIARTSVSGDEMFYLANADDLSLTDIMSDKDFMGEGLCRTQMDEILQDQMDASPGMGNEMIIITGDELVH